MRTINPELYKNFRTQEEREANYAELSKDKPKKLSEYTDEELVEEIERRIDNQLGGRNEKRNNRRTNASIHGGTE